MKTFPKSFTLVVLIGFVSIISTNAAVQLNPNVDKPATLEWTKFEDEYPVSFVSVSVSRTVYSHFNWHVGSPGDYFAYDCKDWGSGSQVYKWDKTAWNSKGNGTRVFGTSSACGSFDNPQTNAYTLWLNANYFNRGNLSRTSMGDSYYGPYYATADRRTVSIHTLHTGGKGNSAEKKLFEFVAVAGTVSDPGLTGGSTVDSTNIVIGDLGALGTNGVLYKALGDNETHDATPLANSAKYWKYGIGFAKYKISHGCASPVPGDRYNRTTLGVGEEVDFGANLVTAQNLSGLWIPPVGVSTCSATAGSTFGAVFIAPSNAVAHVTVSAIVKGVSFPTDFSVVEPTGVDHADVIERQFYGLEQAAAGMHLKPYIGPTNVSFYRVTCMEVGQPTSNIQGYFTTHPFGPHDYAAGADHFNIQLGYDNSWPTGYDWARSGTLAPQWSSGSCTWHIPGKWRIGNGPTNDLANTWDQNLTISSDGTVTVSKFGRTVTRHINEYYGTVTP